MPSLTDYGNTKSDYGASQLGSATAPAQPPLGSLYDAMRHLSEAVQFARSTADHLCGGQPEAVSKDGKSASAGYFSQIEEAAAEIHSQAARIAADMQRIQNRL